jgi:hypothetical protein
MVGYRSRTPWGCLELGEDRFTELLDASRACSPDGLISRRRGRPSNRALDPSGPLPATAGKSGSTFCAIKLYARAARFLRLRVVILAKKGEAQLDVKEEKTLGDVLVGHWYYRSKGLALDAMLRGQSFRAVLDIGAGSGIFSKQLLQAGAESAICIDPAYQEERRELFNGKPIRFLRQIGSEKCDLILLMDVLEHVDDDVALIRSALVGAAEHAYVLITVPAFQRLFSAHDIFLEHKRRYTLRQVEGMVRAAGLELLSTRYFFAFLLPIAATLRLLRQQSEAKSDLKEHSKLVNLMLCWLHHLELPFFRFNRIGGLTIFCLARVP